MSSWLFSDMQKAVVKHNCDTLFKFLIFCFMYSPAIASTARPELYQKSCNLPSWTKPRYNNPENIKILYLFCCVGGQT